ncbi:MAG: YbaB/EbfC family nucleoid-associated protein [Thermodesulfobacteriota bacterium]|nr:YbaB/EbfC family nucleoid-associated protein [Thermodesulfobacteriota bacterium]
MAKGFGNIMKQAKMMQEQIGKVQEELAGKTVEASAGGGMIVAVVSGAQELISIKIDPEVVDPDDIEMLQDLIVAAVNEGIKRSQEMMAAEMSKITGGMNIPGLM